MVRWYHAIISAYGFWLPNDPRGSWSDFVYAYELYRHGGNATKVVTKRSHAHDPHDAATRRQTKQHLKHPPARFDAPARQSIAVGFARTISEFNFRLYACAIGFDHVHVVLGRDPARSVEQVVAVLKARATTQMKADATHPMRQVPGCPTAWAAGCWSVFINDDFQRRNAIAYVECHPEKEGLRAQPWDFLSPV